MPGSGPLGLIDRTSERAHLARLLERPGPTLALLTGRRRVGKTYLLTHAWPEEVTFHFTATETTPEQNRRQLILDLAAWTGEDLRPEDHPTWRSVFDLLWRVREPLPQVIVLDEFQYLGGDDRGLAEVSSAINSTKERSRSTRPFVLVLSGSAVTTMEGLAAGGAPLYGRLDLHLRIEPLEAYDAAAFVPAWDLRSKAAAYGVLGGVPAYWAALDPSVDLRTNIAGQVLSREGTVRLQLDTVLSQEQGLADTAAYTAIVRAVAGGATTRQRIAQQAGLKADTSLNRRLEALVSTGFLQEKRMIEAPRNAPLRYAVADPALRFYHAFVTPNASLLERAEPLAVFDEVIAPRLSTFLGLPFERLAAQTYDRLRSRRQLPLVTDWSRWEGKDRQGAPLELDVVAPLADGRVMTGAVKFSSKPIQADVFFRHLEAVARAADAGLRWAHAARGGGPLLFLSAAGFSRSFERAALAHPQPVLAWGLADVFAEA